MSVNYVTKETLERLQAELQHMRGVERPAASRAIAEAREKGDLKEFAELMNVHWDHKKQRSVNMTNTQIDEWYELARKNGALGGKMIGAGGGGFLMFYAQDKVKLRHVMREARLQEVRFRFDFMGTQVVTQS